MARAPRVVPFNPAPRDADLDQIVQEGTIWERPKGADIIYLTGRVWDQTGRAPLRSDVRIVYNGRVYEPGDGFRFDSSSVGAQAGVIGDRAGTIGDRVGTIAPPPPRPKPTLRESEGTVGVAPPPPRPTSIAEAARPSAPPPPPRPTLGESRGTLDSPPKPPPPREVPSDPFENIPRDRPVVQEPPPPPPRIPPEEQVRPPSISADEDAAAKRSILRVRDRWGRKKRDNERRYEEERIVPSMEEAVEAEVQEERVDQIVAQVEAVDKALDEVVEVADVPESSSIDVLVAEDVEEILRIRRQNTADHPDYYKSRGERIYATRSKFDLGGSRLDNELKIDTISSRDRREYEEMLAEVLEREAFADKLAAITGFSFPDEGGIVNNLYDSPDDVPEEVLEAVAELVRNTKFIDKFIGDQKPPEDLKQLFFYAAQLANKNESTHRETVQLRLEVNYRRKLLTDPPKYVTRTELAQRVGFSSWEEAREAAQTDQALALHLDRMETAARYGYDFYDDTVRDLDTEIGEAAYKITRLTRAGRQVYLKRDNSRFGVGQQIPKDVTSEDVARLTREFIAEADKFLPKAFSEEARAIITERVRAIEAMSPEEVETLVLNYARQVLEDPDTRIGVMIDPKDAPALKRQGRYLTTHSKLSASRSDDYDAARVVYETGMLQMPADEDTRADLAPSSGFLIPGARMRAARREAEEKYVEEFGVPYDPANATPEQHAFFENVRISQASVGIEAYAEELVVLKPSVKAKSRFTEGDSFNEFAMTSLMQNPDGSPLSDQQLRNALFGRGTFTKELSTGGGDGGHLGPTKHTLGNFFVAAALGLDPAILGRHRAMDREINEAWDEGDIDKEIAVGARFLHGHTKVSEFAMGFPYSAAYIETMTFGGFHTSEIESASEGLRDILDVAIPAEVQQQIESYSGQFLPTSAFVEENIEQTTRSALNRAAAATGTDLPETGGTAKFLTARAGELPGKFVSTITIMELRADLKSRREVLLLLEADPDADPDAIAFAKKEIETLLRGIGRLDKGKDIAVVPHTSSSDGWPSYLRVDHPSIVAQIHAATDKLSPEVRPETVIVSFDAPYGGGMYVHGRGGVIYIHPAALDWKDASFNINQKDLATRLAKAGATSPEEFDAFFRPSQAWVDDIIIHEGFHRVDFLLAKASKDPQAAASLLSSPEMAAAFDEWLTTSMPFLLEYFEGVDKADLRLHEFAYLGELLGVTGTDRDEAVRSKLVKLYAARVKKPVDSVDPDVALKEERWRLISEVYAELARLDAKGIPFPNSEILIDGMTPAFSRIYEGSDGSGDVLRAAFADAAASLSDIDDAVGAAQAGLDSAVRDVASDVSASVDDIDDTVESLRVGAIPVRRGLYDGVDGAYVPDPVTRDDIARNLGFADADELDAAIADDPIMANNARILEELATYGFDIGVVGSLSADEARARYEAAKPGGYMATRHVSKPVDTAEIKDIMDGMASKLRKSLAEADALPQDPDRVKQSAKKRELLERIEATSPEEAKQLLIDFMRDIFDDPDTTMAVNTGFLDEVMESGRFLSVREAPKNRSEGGDGYARYDTERALWGLHEDTPGSLSPAYGFVVSGAQRRAAREKALEEYGARVETLPDGTTGIRWGYSEEIRDEVLEIALEVTNDLYPGVTRSADLPDDEAKRIVADAIHKKVVERFGLNAIDAKFRKEAVNKELKSLRLPGYGDGVILIDPKVMHRSTFTQGDTVNGAGRPVHYSRNMTDQQLLDMAARAERNPSKSRDRGEALLARAILGYDSRSLNRSKVSEETTGVFMGDVAPVFEHDYIEAQIFGAFTTEEILTATDGKREFDPAPYAPAVPTDLTPESEVAAIKAQLAAERAGQSIDAVVADAAATIDDLDDAGDEVVSFMARSSDDIDPNFGLPPGPDSPTEWDRERLSNADRLDGFTQPPTNISALDGEGLREDQKSLNRVVAEAATEEDLVPLQEALRQAVEDEGSPLYLEAERGSLSDEKTFKVIQALDDLIAFRSSSDESADQQQRIREAEEELAIQLRNAIGHHWGAARSEVFHWDFLSERVQTVLGDEFGVSIQHERRESPSDFESIRNLQEALAPFVDAWARSQYSATQQYLKENDITEVNLYRGLFIPRSKSSEVPRGTTTDRGVPRARGLQSWTSRLETALLFLGNKYETAKDEIKKIEDSGEDLAMPEHVLLHDVVPAELIFGFASDAHKESFRFGVSVEQEVVVLGDSSRRVNMLGDDFLDLHREPSGNFIIDRRESAFRLSEDEVFDYLSSDAEVTQLDNLSSADELTGVDDLTASVERIQEQFGLQDLETRLDSGSRIFYDMETDLYFALDDSGDGPTEIQTFESFDDFVYSIDTSELEEQALQDWREGDAKRTVVFHGTTAEALETIRTEGLDPRSDTRGIVNRGVGDAVYTSETADAAEAFYDVVVEIDLPRAIEDGVISVDSLDREPDVIRNEVLEGIASSFAVDDFVPEESFDGTRPDTVVISERIPPEYLLVNGEPLVPQSVSANPDFGLPPGPDTPTQWARGRLDKAEIQNSDLPDANLSVVLGDGLREDQKSVSKLLVEASSEDLRELNETIGAYWKAELVKDLRGRQPWVNLSRQLEKLLDKRKETSQRKDLALAEQGVMTELQDLINRSWTSSRDEVMHWDFMSEIVQNVLGDEFGISVVHERREPPSDVESIQKLQELLTPFVEAWARGQYAATQQYLKDNDITEVNLYRGLFIPTAKGDGRDGTATARGVGSVRGLQSWTRSLEMALNFAGNRYGTAKNEIAEIEESGEELDLPEHMLLHDVVPAELIFGIASYDSSSNTGFSFGYGKESEVVVLGSSRPVDILGDDFLRTYQISGDTIPEPPTYIARSSHPTRRTSYRLSENDLFDYLSSETPNDLDTER